tara:strand:- start:598 stop:1266 length:669 start_codon:yes stop_codon:yes gene_type:complete
MLRDGIFCAMVGLAGGLFIAALARIVDAIHPSAPVWSAIGVISLIAIASGCYLAGKAYAADVRLAARRTAGVSLLAGLALTIVLAILYAMPVFRPSFVAVHADLVGPMIGLLFFPVLLIAMSARIAMRRETPQTVVVLATVLGGVGGLAIPEIAVVQSISPAWPIVTGVLILHLAGIWAVRSGDITARGQSMVGALSLAAIVVSTILAAVMHSELGFAIGSV